MPVFFSLWLALKEKGSLSVNRVYLFCHVLVPIYGNCRFYLLNFRNSWGKLDLPYSLSYLTPLFPRDIAYKKKILRLVLRLELFMVWVCVRACSNCSIYNSRNLLYWSAESRLYFPRDESISFVSHSTCSVLKKSETKKRQLLLLCLMMTTFFSCLDSLFCVSVMHRKYSR